MLAFLTLIATSAWSDALVTGPLTELWISDSSGTQTAWLRTSAPFTSTCGQSLGYMFIALNEANGKEAYAMALAAFMSGTDVTIGGTGTCSTPYEKIKYIKLIR